MVEIGRVEVVGADRNRGRARGGRVRGRGVSHAGIEDDVQRFPTAEGDRVGRVVQVVAVLVAQQLRVVDRKSTRLNSSHGYISYAVFCLKKKKTKKERIDVYNLIQ